MPKVLILDTVFYNRGVVRGLKDADLEVDNTDIVREGVRLTREGDYDAILMDPHAMGEQSEEEFRGGSAKSIADTSRQREIPLLIWSPGPMPDLEKEYGLAREDYRTTVKKPIRVPELVDTIRALL